MSELREATLQMQGDRVVHGVTDPATLQVLDETVAVLDANGVLVEDVLASGRAQILVDFTDVSFMDSSGIGELVSSLRTVERFGGSLKILNPGKRVQDSLSMTRLLPIFEIFEDVETAVDSFDPSA